MDQDFLSDKTTKLTFLLRDKKSLKKMLIQKNYKLMILSLQKLL